MKQNHATIPEILTLPMIPLRDAVLFPGMMMPFLVGREYSLKALASALKATADYFLLLNDRLKLQIHGLKTFFPSAVSVTLWKASGRMMGIQKC